MFKNDDDLPTSLALPSILPRYNTAVIVWANKFSWIFDCSSEKSFTTFASHCIEMIACCSIVANDAYLEINLLKHSTRGSLPEFLPWNRRFLGWMPTNPFLYPYKMSLVSNLFSIPTQLQSFQSEILIMKRTGMSLSKPSWPVSFIIHMQLLWSSYSMELSEFDVYNVHFRIF